MIVDIIVLTRHPTNETRSLLERGRAFAQEFILRNTDLAKRSERAGSQVKRVRELSEISGLEFDIVLCDAPCSGSGAWRRDPDGKWALTPERLRDLQRLQQEILLEAQRYVNPSGKLVYVTCSVLASENEDISNSFQGEQSNFRLVFERRISPLEGGDGFYTAHFQRKM